MRGGRFPSANANVVSIDRVTLNPGHRSPPGAHPHNMVIINLVVIYMGIAAQAVPDPDAVIID